MIFVPSSNSLDNYIIYTLMTAGRSARDSSARDSSARNSSARDSSTLLVTTGNISL